MDESVDESADNSRREVDNRRLEVHEPLGAVDGNADRVDAAWMPPPTPAHNI